MRFAVRSMRPTLALACEVSSKVPVVDKVEDALSWKGDRDLDKWLAVYKHAIEA